MGAAGGGREGLACCAAAAAGAGRRGADVHASGLRCWCLFALVHPVAPTHPSTRPPTRPPARPPAHPPTHPPLSPNAPAPSLPAGAVDERGGSDPLRRHRRRHVPQSPAHGWVAARTAACTAAVLLCRRLRRCRPYLPLLRHRCRRRTFAPQPRRCLRFPPFPPACMCILFPKTTPACNHVCLQALSCL